MALYWLCYRRDRLQAGAVLADARSLRHARTLTAFQGLDVGLEFAGGHALDPQRLALVYRDENRPVALAGRSASLAGAI
jgi:hypothetical protein